MSTTNYGEPAGRLVGVGAGCRHVREHGARSAAPTVVLESGLASPLQTWEWVQRSLGESVQTIAYERAGCGWSTPGSGPRSVPRLAGELRELLTALGVEGPVVLVGHSFGGLITRCYAETWPDDVAGVVFVDALHPEELRRSATQRRGMAWLEQSLKLSAARALFGLGRKQAREQFSDLPEEAAAAARARLHVSATWRAAAAELVSWKTADPRALVRGRFPSTVGVGVVISGESLRNDVAHRKLQDDLLTLSNGAFPVLAQEASHFGLVLQRRWAELVADTVRKVISESAAGSAVAGGTGTTEEVR
ncbi:Alpha/beta hydrolase family protein [Amycolatopsis marina]|uniref:Alpha/beta hydrolase family protein n=1 Tax=Amycolatopsis marina TaxID=490629 RepID=A0A1I1BDZ3_9PSEU|nr:alpha/beta hydrolase [Amycolatopsis marina]SFB47982.1 Alpha/beta hydrolase family protein [Amycolatopsis marina]